jgi:hypothetical protein
MGLQSPKGAHMAGYACLFLFTGALALLIEDNW